MKTTDDQAALLLYAFSTLPHTGVSTAFLTGFLYTVIYICIYGRLRHRLLRGIFTAVYLAAALYYPPVLCFSPAIIYTLLTDKDYAGMALNLILCLRQRSLFLIPGYAIAGLLHYKTAIYQALDNQYRQTRDDGTERTLLLKEKNQALLENQNYEIYTATLKERNRIAREIHDHVGHMLSRSILLTGAVKTINTDPVVGQSLEHLEDTLNTAMDNIRCSVHGLHDESLNLKDTLENLTASFMFCPVTLKYDMGYDVPIDVKYCLTAIVKEALHNISRHSNADRAWIILREHPGLYQLSIEDNGTPAKTFSTGMGLSNMWERTHSLGGNMQIYTDRGFRIFITIPKKTMV